MKQCIVYGWNSTISKSFRNILLNEIQYDRGDINSNNHVLDADYYLFSVGVLRAKQMCNQTYREIFEGYQVNYSKVADICSDILANNDKAKICIIGSESAYRGSYDRVYSDAKRKLHKYVEMKQVKGEQQLVCISPWIIEDSGMTERREDIENLSTKKREHPKGRFLTALEVASMAHYLLFKQNYVTGTVIRMHGGLK